MNTLTPMHLPRYKLVRKVAQWPIMALFSFVVTPFTIVALLWHTPASWYGRGLDYIPGAWQPVVGVLFVLLYLSALRWRIPGSLAFMTVYWAMVGIDAAVMHNPRGVVTNLGVFFLVFLEVKYILPYRLAGVQVATAMRDAGDPWT